MEVQLISATGSNGGTTSLPERLVADGRNNHAVYEAIKMYQANRRVGSVHRKNRSAVSGGSAKPWRQKGTGRARQGSIRAPQWRGGGRAFPPMERDYSHRIPKKVRRLATRTAIGAKAANGTLRVIESLPEFTGKTREMAQFLASLGVAGRRVLILVDEPSPLLLRAARNIPGLSVGRLVDTNALQVLHAEEVFIAKEAIDRFSSAPNEAETAAPEEPQGGVE